MIKYFCDRDCCKKEIKDMMITSIDGFHLCNNCANKFYIMRSRLDEDNIIKKFINMTDEDFELSCYDFKVGDEVITCEGLIGVITDICDCEKCKERGFYEPQVKTILGSSGIYITDTEKNAGFPSFYKIGNHTFGNIDLDYITGRIDYEERELIFLEQQKEILMDLVKENKSC